ncbi:MAG: hypothetical protein K2J27_07890 [Duncaniella sp.]|nr:hypothetical protein [Duncaniella sp.]
MPKSLNTSKLIKDIENCSLTKVQLAEKCGISRVTLDTVLKGKEIGLHKFLKLINVLGKNIGYYFDECESAPKIEVKTDVEASSTSQSDNINVENEVKETGRLSRLVDTIVILQEIINTQRDTIAALTERIKQLESQLQK